MKRIDTHIGLQAAALVSFGAFALAQTHLRPHNPAPQPSPAPVPYCFGDATSPACPCDNQGAPGRGCQNSALTGGALLWASGQSKVYNDTLQLHVQGTLPTSLCVVLQGNALHAAANFGDGLRCMEGNLRRLYVQNAAGGMLDVPSLDQTPIWARSNALGDLIVPGSKRYYQVYYRDPTGRFCDFPLGGATNISNGMQVTWVK